MAANESFHIFLRLIQEKHQQFASTSDTLLRSLVGENPDEKRAAANSALQAATDLRGLLAKKDVPKWLNDAINSLKNFVDGLWSTFDLLSNYIPIKSAIENHDWTFDVSDEAAFDFDSIFENFKKDSRLPELFDSIVKILEDIEASGDVDSVTMLRSLGKVIATIKRSRDGSYFSVNSAWEFLISFLKNYMWGELSKVPVLGTALEALEKTIKETNEEMFKLHQQVQDEMNKVVEGEISVLKDKSEFQFIAYDRKGHLLSSPNHLTLSSGTA